MTTNSLQPLAPFLAGMVFETAPAPERRGGHNRVAAPHSGAQRQREYKGRKKEKRIERIAVLDMETDPFNNVTKEAVFPFVAELYSDHFEPVVIWEEDFPTFVSRVLAAIEALPDEYVIYAHNGGKFDWMFLLHKLRGDVSFKGRGIMAAKIGKHEIRDSFHIIPEKLASYKKDDFDYRLLTKAKRNKNKQVILDYLHADCRYLFDIVKKFLQDYGFRLSIGQAAITVLRQSGYNYGKLTEGTDAYLRNWFFGGRVECLAGKGHWRGPYKLYDVNSMYPEAMAKYAHPISSNYISRRGQPGKDTVFIDLECKNYGALVSRDDDGETTAHKAEGRFKTTIWEYEAALELGLIEDVKILWCIDNPERVTFDRFVLPLYEKRQLTKRQLKAMAKDGDTESMQYLDIKKDDIFYKLILNNAYGKFCQNPRRFKENYITDLGERPPEELEGFGDLPSVENEAMGYAIWSRPTVRQSFNNVGTGASITGAARAILMRAIYNAVDPIYCDTDSLICRELLNTKLDPEELGAWDLEAEFSEVIVCGKKLYACKQTDGKIKIRSKGTAGLTWDDMENMLRDEAVSMVNKGPTLTRAGTQNYITRRVRATAKNPNAALQLKLGQRKFG